MTAYWSNGSCRACHMKGHLVSVLDLGRQPPANAFLTDEQLDELEVRYPLEMMRCTTCGLCQLSVVVNPEVLYRDYVYQSGHAEGWHRHCADLAQEIVAGRPAKPRVLDLGANDGTLLRHCLGLGCDVYGVDPAFGAGADQDLPGTQGFWPCDVPGLFDTVVAQNVFGHVDDARGFLAAIAGVLQPEGEVIIEVPWIFDLIREGRWDTIYHEHLSYWGTGPLKRLGNQVGLTLDRATYWPNLHGGTIRCYLRHRGTSDPLNCVEIDAPDFKRFAIRALGDITRWDHYFQNLHGKAVAGYGASAKFNTFLNALPRRPSLVGIFDDNPRKWNLYCPGTHIPVLKPTPMTLSETDVLIVGAPNWMGEIEARARALGFAGEVKSLW